MKNLKKIMFVCMLSVGVYNDINGAAGFNVAQAVKDAAVSAGIPLGRNPTSGQIEVIRSRLEYYLNGGMINSVSEGDIENIIASPQDYVEPVSPGALEPRRSSDSAQGIFDRIFNGIGEAGSGLLDQVVP